MNTGWEGLIIVGVLLLLLGAGIEIAVSMGITAALGMMLFVHRPLLQFIYSGWDSMNSFTLTAVPLFVFMGSIFAETGVVRALFTGANKLVGWMPGGIACSVVGANAAFGAMCGSSLAATATFGKIAYPEMERLKYSPKLSLGVLVTAGALSSLIPPSVLLIIYGAWQSVSVGRLFAAGLIPGLVMTALMVILIIIWVLLKPEVAPKPPRFTFKERLFAIKDILPFMVVILITLGVIFLGIMTPTEAAAVGAVLAILLAFGYRSMSYRALKESMSSAVTVTAMLAFLLLTARVLSQVFQYIGLTQVFSNLMMGLNLNRYAVMAIIILLYLILGMFFDAMSMLILTLPFVGPLVSQLGFSLVWFGVMFVLLAQIGCISPPFGLHLFVLQNVVPKYDLMTIAMSSLPFMIPYAIELVLLTVFPQIALWLPHLLYD